MIFHLYIPEVRKRQPPKVEEDPGKEKEKDAPAAPTHVPDILTRDDQLQLKASRKASRKTKKTGKGKKKVQSGSKRKTMRKKKTTKQDVSPKRKLLKTPNADAASEPAETPSTIATKEAPSQTWERT